MACRAFQLRMPALKFPPGVGMIKGARVNKIRINKERITALMLGMAGRTPFGVFGVESPFRLDQMVYALMTSEAGLFDGSAFAMAVPAIKMGMGGGDQARRNLIFGMTGRATIFESEERAIG